MAPGGARVAVMSEDDGNAVLLEGGCMLTG